MDHEEEILQYIASNQYISRDIESPSRKGACIVQESPVLKIISVSIKAVW